jgi:hypothetical protein
MAGLSFGMTSKAKAANPLAAYQSQHQNNGQNPKNISVNNRNRFIIGKDAIAGVYIRQPF